MSMAIKYNMAKRARKMAEGGEVGGEAPIGKTVSGKPIYKKPEHEGHKDFSKSDHGDAAMLHSRITESLRSSDPDFNHHSSASSHHDATGRKMPADAASDAIKLNPGGGKARASRNAEDAKAYLSKRSGFAEGGVVNGSDDVVERAMSKRKGVIADGESADYDVLDQEGSHAEADDTGASSGDEDGDDVVSRAMRKRKGTA